MVIMITTEEISVFQSCYCVVHDPVELARGQTVSLFKFQLGLITINKVQKGRKSSLVDYVSFFKTVITVQLQLLETNLKTTL